MLKVLLFFVIFGVMSVSFVNARDCNVCDYWIAEVTQKESSSENCKKDPKDLTDEEILEIIECLLNQKGNKSLHIGVVLRDNVSQTFGSSPVEVVALFYASYLFEGNKDFASAMVLLYDFDDQEPNAPKAVKIAHKSYRKWFEEVKKVGLKKAREMKLDPLKDTKVSWY